MGIITLVAFSTVYFVVSLCFFESRISSADPMARANSRNEFWYNFFKMVCNLMAAIFVGDEYRWVNIIVFAVGGVALYFKRKNERPYYNEVMNVLADVNNGVFLWSTIMLIIVMIAENSSFNGGIQAYLSGLPLVILFLVTKGNRRRKMLLKGIEGYDSGDQWYIKIRYYISFIQTKDMSRDISVELKGFIYNHEEYCVNKNCPLKVYMANMTSLMKDRKKKQAKITSENYTLLMRFANVLFSQGLTKFPTCTSLRIAYAFFLKEHMNNRNLAINELLAAEKNHPPFDEQFLVFRYKKLIEDEMADVRADGQGGALDAISMIAYDNYLRKFKESVEKSAYLHMEFWLEVLEMEPDLGKLDKTGTKIHASIAIVEDFWDKLQKINSNTPKALKLYAEFLIEILNDSEAGGELLSRAKDTIIARTAVNLNNLDAAELLAMEDMCAGLGGVDGTPCVIASGEQGKLGEIIQFNLPICKVFGYTKTELNGKRLNHLMPDLYSKAHDKILQRALNANSDSSELSKSDIFILGRHKSNYLIPLVLQTRTITSVTKGILFIGTFVSDKKGINACYLLLNEQQDIVGVSSRCISMLHLSNRLLNSSRVSFQTLAPSIQDKSTLEQYYGPEAGNLLEFFLPDYKVENDNELQDSSYQKEKNLDFVQNTETFSRKLRIKATKESLKLSCIISEIVLADTFSGYLVRLEKSEEDNELGYKQRIERINKYPNIQFVFDPINMRYIQEDYAEDAQKRIAEETSTYVNIMREKSNSEITPDKSEEKRSDSSTLSGVDEITKLQNALLKGKIYSEGVKTKRMVNGELAYIDAKPRLLEKQMEEEIEKKEKKQKEKEKNKKEDIFQSSLKSKKAFNAALNEKSMPFSIKRLKITGLVIVLAVIALASTEFGVLLSKLKDIKENINIIKYSRKRISIQMKMAFYINKIVLMAKSINPKIPYDQYIYNTSKSLIAESLNDYYAVQDFITLSKISLSKDNYKLYADKCVVLYYKSTNNNRTTRKYTLTEAIQQLASEVFTVQSIDDLSLYSLANDNVDFILYNTFADLYTKLTYSSNLFVKELIDRSQSKKIIIYILYAIELLVCFSSIIFLLPVVSSVSSTRLEVLSLFLDIPQASVRILEKKAEKFVSKSNEEVADDVISNEGEILTGGLLVDGIEEGKAVRYGRRRKFKNNNTSNATFYIQYLFAVLIFVGYFSFNFAYSYIFLGKISKYARELDATTEIHIETATTFAVYQQMLGHRKLLMMGTDQTFQYLADEKIPLMYSKASEIQNSHNNNYNSFTKSYQSIFIEVMRNNLCNLQHFLNFTFDSCESFLDGTIIEGLHPVIIHYIEQLREKLTAYKTLWENSDESTFNETITKSFLSPQIMNITEQTVFEIIDQATEYLIDALIESYSNHYDGEVTKRIIFFICFLALLIVAFVVLWNPFTNKLNNEIWKTKTMLTLIPYEVCKNIASIKNFLNKQSIFSAKPQS